MRARVFLLVPLLLLLSCSEDDGVQLTSESAGVHQQRTSSNGDRAISASQGDVATSGAESQTDARSPSSHVPPGISSATRSAENHLSEKTPESDEPQTGADPKRTNLPRRLSYHRGVNLANLHRGNNGYGSAPSSQRHRKLLSIGVNAIAITPFGFQEGARADGIVGFTGDGEGDDRRRNYLEILGREVDSAHANGLQVMLKPHIWSRDFYGGKEWHGTVRQDSPEEHRRWWKSYREFTLHYARFSRKHSVERLCIGTELVEMTTGYPEEWRELIRDVREIYDGELTYAAHWDREWREIAFWHDLDYIGIASYFPLKLPDDATVAQLAAAWKPYRTDIAAVSKRAKRPVLFLEAGFRPIDGAWREPWLYSGGRSNPEAQAQGFRGLFAAFEEADWFHGLYIWKVFTDSSGWGSDEEEGFRFIGLPAERVVDSVFRKR